MPEAAPGHRGATHLPPGACPGGPGAPQGSAPLAGVPCEWRGCHAAEVLQAWGALRCRLNRLNALGPAYASLELGGTQDRLAPLEPLCRLRTTPASMARATLWAEDKERPQEWRASLEEAQSADRGAVYRWLKLESYTPPVTFLSRLGGTATANMAEVDGLLQEAWRPIKCKYAVNPEPDPAPSLRRYGQHVRRVPMVASLLDGRRLRKGLSRMKPSTLGLDGWSLADLCSLPDRLLDWLADLLREVERLG